MQIHIEKLISQQFKKLQSNSDFLAFKWISEKTRDLSVRNGKPESINSFHDEGLTIEIMKNGHIGYGSTCELTETGIQKAYSVAHKMTELSSENKVFNFNSAIRPASVGTYKSNRIKSLDQLSIAEIYDFLKKISQKMKINDSIINASADSMVIETQQKYFNTSGADIFQDFNIVVNAFAATAKKDSEIQTRSHHGGRGNCLQIGAEFFNVDHFLPACEQIAQQAIELLSAKNCPTQKTDLILAPDQMLLQIHESIGHPLELDRILGDERNFAGWSFVKPEDFGQLKYGSPIMNVLFDPTVTNEMASYNFDEIGNPAEKKFLIKDGVLVAGLGSLESQARSKISGVANARSSSWNRAPIDRMANINLSPGLLTLDQMISNIENGLIMHSNRSWSIDDYRRKFQFGCEYAQEILNGKLGQIFKNPNYRGVTTEFWNNLAGLTHADSVETYGSPYCGKGEPSQIIRVGHSSPYAHFKNIEVFGG